MSVRLVTTTGLVCIGMAFVPMYLAFAQIYAPAAAHAEAQMRGEPPPISIVPFVWPAEVHESWWRFFIAAGLFSAGQAACLVYLARRASSRAPAA